MELFQVGQEIVAVTDRVKMLILSGKIVEMEVGELNLKVKVKGGKIMDVSQDDVVEINSIPRPLVPYYQPRLSDEAMHESGLFSFDVYRHFVNCKEDFPDAVIDVYTGSDIEEHNFVDDADGRSGEHFVDMPNHDDSGDNSNLFITFSESDALVFARVHFQADVNGMICILSNS